MQFRFVKRDAAMSGRFFADTIENSKTADAEKNLANVCFWLCLPLEASVGQLQESLGAFAPAKIGRRFKVALRPRAELVAGSPVFWTA
jgi:hypothetical protein